MYSRALLKFLMKHYSDPQGLRLGQRFCNEYIKGEYPELFYMKNDEKAKDLIEKWLNDHQYTQSLPLKVR